MAVGSVVEGPVHRRNAGRLLVLAVESTSQLDLDGLLARTAQLLVDLGLVGVKPVFDSSVSLRVSGWPLFRSGSDWLCLHRFPEFDLLVGVGSRVKPSKRARGGNVMVEQLLEVLETPDPAGVLYGAVLSLRADRLFRTRQAEAVLTDVLTEWDVTRLDFKGRHDPLDGAGFELEQMFAGWMAQQEVRTLLRKAVDSRAEALEVGVSKFGRGQTPVVVAVHRESRRMSWDLRVVGALREAAALRAAGATWDEAALEVGGRVPSYRLRAESDAKRAVRNARRVQLGRVPVPLRLDGLGELSGAYRPESILDLTYPGTALRQIFVGTCTHEDQRRWMVSELAAQGRVLRDVTRELLVDGVFRRPVKDLDRRSATRAPFRWVSFDLGPVDELGGVLTAAQFDEACQPRKPGQSVFHGQGQTGFIFFKGLFAVEAPDVVYTSGGFRRSTQGEWQFRGRADAHRGKRPSYGIQFRFKNDRRRWVTGGLVEVGVFHRSMRDAIVEALDGGGVPVETGWVARAVSRRSDSALLESRVAQAEAMLEQAMDDYSSPQLSADQRMRLWTVAQKRDDALSQARADLEQHGSGVGDVPLDAVWRVGRTVDILAILGSDRRYGPEATRAIQAALRDVVRDGTIWIDAASGLIRWAATLTFENAEGAVLEHPIGGAFPNEGADLWLNDTEESRWWATATTDTEPRIPAGDVSLRPSPAYRCMKIAERIEAEAAAVDVELRDGAALLIVRMPTWTATRVAMRVALGQPVEDGEGEGFVRNLIVPSGNDAPAALFAGSSHNHWRVWAEVLATHPSLGDVWVEQFS